MIRRVEENADMIGSHAALLRAVRRACEEARMHGLPVAFSREGKVVNASPEDVLAELATHVVPSCAKTRPDY